jgi:hypothetical protein
MRIVIAALAALTLSACAATPPLVIEKPVIQHVEVKTSCLTKEEYARLQSLAPAPLRTRAVPADVETRVAALSAQVIDYEAPGRFRDQVLAALDRCTHP